MRRCAILTAVISLLILTASGMSHALSERSGFRQTTSTGKVLTLRLQNASSIEDLIRISGYTINDENVFSFLSDFLELNPGIKSISSIAKGTMVRVPLSYLGKTEAVTSFRQKSELTAVKRNIVRKREKVPTSAKEKELDRSFLLRSIKDLLLFLGNDVSLESEGFRYFPLSQKSEFTFDTGSFPIVDLHDNRMLVIDYNGDFPEDVGNLLEISWPEYRLISLKNRHDLKNFTGVLLRESGYQVYEKAKIISGGTSQIEYHSDYIVQRRTGEGPEGDFSLVSIISDNEVRTPGQLITWFMDRDVRIFELSEHERTYSNRVPGTVVDAGEMDGSEFARAIIEHAGYPFTTDQKIELSSGKGMKYRLNADIVIDLGYRKKVLQFSEISGYEASYARKLGLDISNIEPWASKREIARRIMSLLSLSYSDAAKNSSSFIGPDNTRYRLLLPGLAARTFRGRLFITDTDLDPQFLQGIMKEGITIVRF